MGVRIGGLLLLCYFGLLLALDGHWRAVAARRVDVLAEHRLGQLSGGFSSRSSAVAYPVMLLFWPWAQTDPIENPLRALAFFSHQTFPFYTLFDGQFVPASDLPWTYLPTYIALALPELVLVLFLCIPVAALVALWRGNFRLTPRAGARELRRRRSGSFSRWPMRSPSRPCCSTACAISSLYCR